MKIKPCTFDYTDEFLGENKKNKNNNIGVIAEDLYEIFPELTGTDENNELSYVKYIDFVIPLVSEVQRLNKIIDGQNSEISNLKSELSSVKSTLNCILETINTNK